MERIERPRAKPKDPRFSSGPCRKPPTWSLQAIADAKLGLSHRAEPALSRIQRAIALMRDLLAVPEDFHVGIVPASDTGAVEMALWSLLGPRKVDVLAWEAFGRTWLTDTVEQLRLDARIHLAEYGCLPDLSAVDPKRDLVFTWNGTTSGVRVPDGSFISSRREGVVICDATSAAFAVDLPWDRLDATTFSWQKVLGGEAAHGTIVLSPGAVERLESWQPPWPMPKIFRLTKNGRFNRGIFRGSTINTPSLMCIEDLIHALEWALSIGGREALISRANANADVVSRFVDSRPWLDYLAREPETRSNTSVCLVFTDERVPEHAMPGFSRAVAARLAGEGVAFDVNSYMSAPPGLRIWCGATVDRSDLEALMPWIEWAYKIELQRLEGGT